MYHKRFIVSTVIISIFAYIACRYIEEQHNQLPCENSCVRFCCDQNDSCNFNVSYMSKAKKLDPNYEHISGVECKVNDEMSINNWEFLEARNSYNFYVFMLIFINF